MLRLLTPPRNQSRLWGEHSKEGAKHEKTTANNITYRFYYIGDRFFVGSHGGITGSTISYGPRNDTYHNVLDRTVSSPFLQQHPRQEPEFSPETASIFISQCFRTDDDYIKVKQGNRRARAARIRSADQFGGSAEDVEEGGPGSREAVGLVWSLGLGMSAPL